MRQAIIFRDLESLARCLERIEADPDVEVVRIKNRYYTSYDADETAGYRLV